MTVWWISDPLTYLRNKNNQKVKISFPEIKEFYWKMSGMKNVWIFKIFRERIKRAERLLL